jgi:hypothetical protein
MHRLAVLVNEDRQIQSVQHSELPHVVVPVSGDGHHV